MTNQEAYIKGFNKVASEAGVDPALLIKYAQEKGYLDHIKDFISSAGSAIKDQYKKLTPHGKAGLFGGALTGLGTLLLSGGNFGSRLLKALLMGGLGAAGGYSISDKGVAAKKFWNDLTSNAPKA